MPSESPFDIARRLGRLKAQTDHAASVDTALRSADTSDAGAKYTVNIAQRAYQDSDRSGYTVAIALDQHVKAEASLRGLDHPTQKAGFAVYQATAVYNNARTEYTAAIKQNPPPYVVAHAEAKYASSLAGVKAFLDQKPTTDLPLTANPGYAFLRSSIGRREQNYERNNGRPADLDGLARHPAVRFSEARDPHEELFNGDYQDKLRAQAKEVKRIDKHVNPRLGRRILQSFGFGPSAKKVMLDALASPDATAYGVRLAASHYASVKAYGDAWDRRESQMGPARVKPIEITNNDTARGWHKALDHLLKNSDYSAEKVNLIDQALLSHNVARQTVGGRDDLVQAREMAYDANQKYIEPAFLKNPVIERKGLRENFDKVRDEVYTQTAEVRDLINRGKVREFPVETIHAPERASSFRSDASDPFERSAAPSYRTNASSVASSLSRASTFTPSNDLSRSPTLDASSTVATVGRSSTFPPKEFGQASTFVPSNDLSRSSTLDPSQNNGGNRTGGSVIRLQTRKALTSDEFYALHEKVMAVGGHEAQSPGEGAPAGQKEAAVTGDLTRTLARLQTLEKHRHAIAHDDFQALRTAVIDNDDTPTAPANSMTEHDRAAFAQATQGATHGIEPGGDLAVQHQMDLLNSAPHLKEDLDNARAMQRALLGIPDAPEPASPGTTPRLPEEQGRRDQERAGLGERDPREEIRSRPVRSASVHSR